MKKSKMLLISAITGSAYLLFVLCYFIYAVIVACSDDVENFYAFIVASILVPHLAATVSAVIINWLGWIQASKNKALYAVIFYCVSGFTFLFFLPFFFPVILLSFIGLANTSKINKQAMLSK